MVAAAALMTRTTSAPMTRDTTVLSDAETCLGFPAGRDKRISLWPLANVFFEAHLKQFSYPANGPRNGMARSALTW